MTNRICRVLTALCITLAFPFLVLASPATLTTSATPGSINAKPFSTNIKLNAVNKLRQDLKLAPVPTMPPAKVILTPKVPTMGESFFEVFGYYSNKKGITGLAYQSSTKELHNINFFFHTVPGKTYLLDLIIGNNGYKWNCQLPVYGLPGALSDHEMSVQQGHLLIPFVAYSDKTNIRLFPKDHPNVYQYFSSAELTQVN
jgi:hypothetical protein